MASSKLPILNTALHNIKCNACFVQNAYIPQFIASSGRLLWGWFFFIIDSLSFFGFLYAAVISKLLPSSDNAVISAIQNDWYYCFLVPLTLPILVVSMYFNWLNMKLFKHA